MGGCGRRRPPLSPPLPREFYARPVLDVARDLLGCLLVAGPVRSRVAIRISEVEAYAGTADAASHGHRGRTDRNAAMFGPPGHAYVYFTYGMHWCVNLVAGDDGVPAAVLLRAGAVVAGADLARTRRGTSADRDLARGPARLAQAAGITGELNGADVTSSRSPLRVEAGDPVPEGLVSAGPRVGIRAATELPWRLWTTGDPSVSTFRAGALRRRSPGQLGAGDGAGEGAGDGDSARGGAGV